MSSTLRTILDKIASTSQRHGTNGAVRLVAVSKTKPPELIRAAYDAGQQHFGENYVQELVEKANHPLLCDLDIRWHFVGHLQRNKAKLLASVPHLWMVETIDTPKLATSLNSSWSNLALPQKLKVMVQVNTSGEESKHGCPPEGTVELTNHILQSCPQLDFTGLMTIGRLSHDYSQGPNPDFELMHQLKLKIVDQLGLLEEKVELSMGMSADFEEAIAAGSTNVRVGSTIFGTRTYN
ncbi:pyridoxal phosphate homeostasis protein-like [Gigantopelta aegis]|uniref:pyridoxal phosphate homeostasis protein-like n=1 Tax=Gigantopelta aegis TaxID=1735272 RepID=UPI001B88C87B|nr:pyridoxal phosphate homeostasis protein-like [Gigantopelta aegis]